MGLQKLSLDTPYAVGKVHVYAAELNGSLVLFDTGPDSGATINSLREAVDVECVDYVFITHWHPEHCGLAKYFADEIGAQVIVSSVDEKKFQNSDYICRWRKAYLNYLGFPSSLADRMASSEFELTMSAKVPESYRLLEDSDDLLEKLGIRYFPVSWHSQSDIVYLVGDEAIAGDGVVADIFSTPLLDPDFSKKSWRRFNNYNAFCDAVEALYEHDQYSFLPSHKSQIDSIDTWVACVVDKVVGRAKQLESAFNNGSFYEAFSSIWPSDKHHPIFLYVKLSEVLFIHDFLNEPSRLLDVLTTRGVAPDFHALPLQFSAAGFLGSEQSFELGKVKP